MCEPLRKTAKKQEAQLQDFNEASDPSNPMKAMESTAGLKVLHCALWFPVRSTRGFGRAGMLRARPLGWTDTAVLLYVP